MIARVRPVPVRGQNQEFRAWAKANGYRVRKQPEALQGEGDVWAIPLKGRRGWLWDAGPNTLGVHVQGSPRVVNEAARQLASAGHFRLQTLAGDAVCGWIDRSAAKCLSLAGIYPMLAPRVDSETARQAGQRLRAASAPASSPSPASSPTPR